MKTIYTSNDNGNKGRVHVYRQTNIEYQTSVEYSATVRRGSCGVLFIGLIAIAMLAAVIIMAL
jgi:hypothetical protein